MRGNAVALPCDIEILRPPLDDMMDVKLSTRSP
jgi:hypothetical protein